MSVNFDELQSRQNLMFNPLIFIRRCVVLWCWFVWSNLCYNLMKTWFNNFLLVDFDIIEEWNLLNQTYTEEDLWKKKTEALANQLILNAPMSIYTEQANDIRDIIDWKVELIDWDIIFLSADNVDIRRDFVGWYVKQQESWNLLNCIIVIVWTSSDVIWIYINQKSIQGLKKMYDVYNKPKDNYNSWLCWNKSAYFLGSLISWIAISHLKNDFFPYDIEQEVSKIWVNNTNELVDFKF